MVGNVWEWVLEWQPSGADCLESWSFSDDDSCLAGLGAPSRGGDFYESYHDGVFAVQTWDLVAWNEFLGFRCAR